MMFGQQCSTELEDPYVDQKVDLWLLFDASTTWKAVQSKAKSALPEDWQQWQYTIFWEWLYVLSKIIARNFKTKEDWKIIWIK